MRAIVRPMTLRDVLEEHGIHSIADFRRRTGLSKQHAWNLWHGRANVGLHLAERLAACLDIPLSVLVTLERTVPPAPRPPGRPRKPRQADEPRREP
jgi:transcriptional regulator with XRE-family HTH domain